MTWETSVRDLIILVQETKTDRLDEILERLKRIETHLGISKEPPPPQLLRVIQYHQLHVDLSGSFYAASLCGYDEPDGPESRLSLSKCQDIVDARNVQILCLSAVKRLKRNIRGK